MKISLWSIGKAHEAYIKAGVEEFTKRIGRYYPVEWQIINPPKNAGLLAPVDLKKKEGALLLSMLKQEDYLVALDEHGKGLTSKQLGELIQQRADTGIRQLIFLIGGAYGIDPEVLKRAQFTWSLSQLTFPHQLVRLILAEQVYRACTIQRNEKYHHR
jgi:23S rRNA (pseudouridine1915-N3)-methyltransferase